MTHAVEKKHPATFKKWLELLMYSSWPRKCWHEPEKCWPLLWFRLCDSSGQWTGTAPQCRLISCGDPPMLPHSAVALLNGSTQWRAQAVYSCLPGYNNINGKCQCSEGFPNLIRSYPQKLIFDILRLQGVQKHLENIQFDFNLFCSIENYYMELSNQ